MRHRCLTDIAGPFYDTTKPFRNWSAMPFYQLDLPDRPYVDQQQLAQGLDRALVYLDHIHAQGYTGIAFDNLAHLVTFERAPIRIYRADSSYLRGAAIYRAAFAQLFERAAQLGMDVFVTTDMQWSTPPLLGYIGSLAADSPRLADINRWAVDELFAALPQVSGLIVRTGEAGGAHNQDVGYASHVLYRTAADLRGLGSGLNHTATHRSVRALPCSMTIRMRVLCNSRSLLQESVFRTDSHTIDAADCSIARSDSFRPPLWAQGDGVYSEAHRDRHSPHRCR